jgi:transcriptional regulator with XRE-family HTH domain
MEILRRYMTAQGLNQSQLATHLGTDRFVISKWLNGKKKPRLESLETISHATGIKLEALVKSLNGRRGAKSNGS